MNTQEAFEKALSFKSNFKVVAIAKGENLYNMADWFRDEDFLDEMANKLHSHTIEINRYDNGHG